MGLRAPKSGALSQTAMPNPDLPPEILDYIVDILCDKPKALQKCCLAAKSWVPRARKHLFAEIDFCSLEHLEAWKKTFPDPSKSPAYHTHTLSVYRPYTVASADSGGGGWIQTFSRVTRLNVGENIRDTTHPKASLDPFRRFSPVLKSLHVSSIWLSNSQIFDLVSSLPLLEDLSLTTCGTENDGLNVGGPPTTIKPSISPVFTGTLELTPLREIKHTVRWLLDLPNGLRFRKLRLSWAREGHLLWINALVKGCSDTLECLDVTCHVLGATVRPLRWN